MGLINPFIRSLSPGSIARIERKSVHFPQATNEQLLCDSIVDRVRRGKFNPEQNPDIQDVLEIRYGVHAQQTNKGFLSPTVEFPQGFGSLFTNYSPSLVSETGSHFSPSSFTLRPSSPENTAITSVRPVSASADLQEVSPALEQSTLGRPSNKKGSYSRPYDESRRNKTDEQRAAQASGKPWFDRHKQPHRPDSPFMTRKYRRESKYHTITGTIGDPDPQGLYRYTYSTNPTSRTKIHKVTK